MSKTETSIENIYKLEGKVPVAKAIPFGLQHILAMFVANIAPIIIVAAACGLSASEVAGDFRNLPSYCPDGICRKLRRCCIYRRNHSESCTSEEHGGTYD